MFYAEVMEKIRGAKSSVFRGKGKVRNSGKSATRPIDLNLVIPNHPLLLGRKRENGANMKSGS